MWIKISQEQYIYNNSNNYREQDILPLQVGMAQGGEVDVLGIKTFELFINVKDSPLDSLFFIHRDSFEIA